MRPGKELNRQIATEIFGYNVFKHKGVMSEDHPLGIRPLRNYSNDIQHAWEVAEHMKVSLMPIPNNQWFAFVGPSDKDGWDSPQDALAFLESGKFNGAGAAVGENPSMAICMAALHAMAKRKKASDSAVIDATEAASDSPPEENPEPTSIH